MKANKTVLSLSLLLALLVAFVSIVGITNPATYAQETPNWQAQSIGQDYVDLLLVLPFLLISTVLLYIGRKRAIYVWGGSLSFLLYTFTIYCFDIHFSSLFVIYCTVLGLSFYLFMFFLYEHIKHHIINGFADLKEAKVTGFYFITIAAVFYLIWLAQIIPSITTAKLSPDLVNAGLLTNPVHVIDLSVCLPAFFIVGVLLLKRVELGYALAPVMLTFSVLMDLNLVGLMLFMHRQGIETSNALTAVMAILSVISVVLLILTLKNLKFDEEFK
jgi:hypothetical protein